MIKTPIEPQNIKIGDRVSGIQSSHIEIEPFTVKEIEVGGTCVGSICEVQKPCSAYIVWTINPSGQKSGRCSHYTEFFLLTEDFINSVKEI